MTYSYSFSVWPADRMNQAMYKLFRAMGTRAEMEFTEAEFENFRDGLAAHGLTLREVERVPFHKPEAVF